MHLIIGNKNYSSWSLRPWLLMKEKGVAFSETRIPLYTDSSKAALLTYSPAGLVPVLTDGDVTLWDSLAICEYIAEQFPERQCWPKDVQARALARSISHEMHAGFATIRNTLPMNCRQSMVFEDVTPALMSEVRRIEEIWTQCRRQYAAEGEYLLGDFTIADAMYAPVVLRFASYGIPVGKLAQDYMATLLENPSLKQWVDAGVAETEIIEMAEI